MNRTGLTIAALLAILVGVGAAWWVLSRAPGGVSGDTVSDQRALPAFRRIVLEGNAEVTLVQGAAEAIAIEVSGASRVRADVHDAVLTVRADDARHWWSSLFRAGRRTPRVTVTFRELESLRASGAVKLAADRLRADTLGLRFSGAAGVRISGLEARALSINGSGAFKAELAGRADEQRVSISGAGEYLAGDLVSEQASIAVSGAGRVLVNARKALDVDVSGAARIDYKGDPQLTQRVRGAGRIRRYDSAERHMHVAATN